MDKNEYSNTKYVDSFPKHSIQELYPFLEFHHAQDRQQWMISSCGQLRQVQASMMVDGATHKLTYIIVIIHFGTESHAFIVAYNVT